MTTVRLRILHETNPEKYYPALFELERQGLVKITGTHRYSVVKEWLRAGLKDRAPLARRSLNALSDLWLRLYMPWIANETIVMGFAPWDWRLLIYRGLAQRNHVIYHTSWHDWRVDHTPRQPRPKFLRRWLHACWLNFLAQPNVTVVAVTNNVAQAVKAESGIQPFVIPHAVPEIFFTEGARRKNSPGPLKLIYVGEVSAKKGIPTLRKIMEDLSDKEVNLTIVGDGALFEELTEKTPPKTRMYGPEWNRQSLAKLMADHDVLLLPSKREGTWEELFGIVIVEALAAGAAVLASDHVGPRNILTPADGAGLIAEGDVDRFIEEILAMCQDRKELVKLRQKQAPLSNEYAIDVVTSMWAAVVKTGGATQ